MASVIYSRRAFGDVDRITKFAIDRGDDPSVVVNVIADAITLLERHPIIGRIAEHDLRELVISRGKTGFVALYDYHPHDDLVVILAIRHQREAGYPPPIEPPAPTRRRRKPKST